MQELATNCREPGRLIRGESLSVLLLLSAPFEILRFGLWQCTRKARGMQCF